MACDQMAFGPILAAQHGIAAAKPMEEKLIMQGLEVTMRGRHTLRARLQGQHPTIWPTSTTRPDQRDGPKLERDGHTRQSGCKDAKQGDYYSTTIGPYDMWVISTATNRSRRSGRGIEEDASRSVVGWLPTRTPRHRLDPLSNRFDMGGGLSTSIARRSSR